MDLQTILLIGALTGGAYFVSRFAIKGDTRVEEKRRRAISLASWASANGLPLASRMASSYAVGDYSGVLGGLRDLHDILADDATGQAVVDRFLKVQLEKKLATPEGRAELEELLKAK